MLGSAHANSNVLKIGVPTCIYIAPFQELDNKRPSTSEGSLCVVGCVPAESRQS